MTDRIGVARPDPSSHPAGPGMLITRSCISCPHRGIPTGWKKFGTTKHLQCPRCIEKHKAKAVA